MKKITYSMILLWSVLLCACQKEDSLTTVPEAGVQLNFSGVQANLTAEELNQAVETFHVIIYNEEGMFMKHTEYENLKSVSPIKLPIGHYTFAYLSNIKSSLITGMEEGKKAEDIILSLEESEGNVLHAGSIFKGIDTLTVGKDNNSNAALQRMVGRLDINLKGVGNDVTVKSVALTGSPKKIYFNGEAEGENIKLNIPIAKTQSGVYKGQAITFPTADSIASLEFVLENNEGEKTFVIPLKNKVEANKIHTINATSNLTGGLWNITLQMETTLWGATVSEDLTANEMLLLDTVRLRLHFSEATNIRSISNTDLLLKNKKNGKEINFFNPQFSTDKDTLVMTQVFSKYDKVSSGEYTITNFICYDTLGTILYNLELCDPQTMIINDNGVAYSNLPALPTVSEADRQAMFDLRDALPADNDYKSNWKKSGEQISLWMGVTLNKEGRVVQIGYNELEDKKSYASPIADTTAGWGTSWSLPESFKNLTALTIFNFDENPMTQIPSFLKDITSLEQLSVSSIDENTIPELPENLRYLEISSNSATLPAHIANLTKLESFSFSGLNTQKITVETDFTQMSNLKELDLDINLNSKNSTLPSSLWNCSQLKELALSGFNNLQIPASLNLNSLTDIYIDNIDLQPSQIEPIKNLSLTHLSISSPTFSQNGFPDWIGTMTTLTSLSLENCGLTEIPTSLEGLINLWNLDVWNNPELSGKLPEKLLERYNNHELRIDYDHESNFIPDGIILKVTPEYLPVFSATGDTCRLTVKSNADWTIEDIDSYYKEYIHFSKTSGNGDATVTITIDANEGIEEYGIPRYFVFSFVAGSHRLDFKTEQEYQQVIVKPTWWNSQVEIFYLGEFSARKYQLVIELTGNTVFDTNEAIIDAAQKLKTFLDVNPVYDDNGILLTIPYAG